MFIDNQILITILLVFVQLTVIILIIKMNLH